MIEIVEKPDGWNREILRMNGGFLQSWEWGEFQRKTGCEPLRLRDAETGARAQMLKRPLPFGKFYWYCPRGPLGGADFLCRHAAAANRKAVFLRVEPLESFTPRECPIMPKSTAPVQPSQTLIVDLRREPEALLAAMHEKTRYNIRLAERKGVRVYPASGKADSFELFWELMGETASRDEFRAHGKTYYRRMLETLCGNPRDGSNETPWAELLFAEHDGRVLAANLMVYFGGVATYLHGASGSVRREVMAPYALHWQAMLRARDLGCRAYDFWGVAPEGAGADHPWAGISRFKRGFGGSDVKYPGAFDLPISRFWYRLYALARKTRP